LNVDWLLLSAGTFASLFSHKLFAAHFAVKVCHEYKIAATPEHLNDQQDPAPLDIISQTGLVCSTFEKVPTAK
jgi:hypothetical protein